MLSGSLRERLAQLKTLKEEEKREEEEKAVASPVASPPPEEKAPAPIEAAPPVADTSPEVDENAEVETEEIVESEVEASEQEADVEASPANVDDDVSSVEQPSQSEVEPSRAESEQDQDVFKALDEAERDDDVSEDESPADTEPEAVTESDKKRPSKEDGSRRKCVIFIAIFLACVAIVAIVLPFYLDYPPGPGKNSGKDASENSEKDDSPIDTEPGETVDFESGSPTISPSNAPSEAPTTLQWGQFLQAFLVPISGEEVFMDESSPQYRAAKYIVDDPYTAEVPTTGKLTDRYASATFYFATEGENWKSCYFGDADCESGQWLVGDVCDWYAVSCDDDGRVVSYIFANAEGNGLVGTFPPEMRLMPFMTDLVIVNDSISGTLPEAFGESARSMRSLLLPGNKLTGQIPDNYLGNSPLEYVHLADNSFSGTVPTKLGKTTTLLQLDLSGNSMTGTISDGIGGYEALEALSLANNKFQGNIPEDIYALTNLKFLHMNGNDLTGTVSKSIRNLLLLKELRVGGSGLSGHIPDELYTLTDLVEVDISQSSFDGRLSLGFLNLESLEKLNVADNKLIGTVPFGFGELSELSDLNLQGNEFSGSIPESVCLLREENLEVLTADCEKLACDCCSTCS